MLGLLALLPDTSNDEEAVVVPAAVPGPGADREEAAPSAGEAIVVTGLLTPIVRTGNNEEAVVAPAAAPSPSADREEAAPGAGEEIIVPGLLRFQRTTLAFLVASIELKRTMERKNLFPHFRPCFISLRTHKMDRLPPWPRRL